MTQAETIALVYVVGILVFMLIDRATCDNEPADGASFFWPFVLLGVLLFYTRRILTQPEEQS